MDWILPSASLMVLGHNNNTNFLLFWNSNKINDICTVQGCGCLKQQKEETLQNFFTLILYVFICLYNTQSAPEQVLKIKVLQCHQIATQCSWDNFMQMRSWIAALVLKVGKKIVSVYGLVWDLIQNLFNGGMTCECPVTIKGYVVKSDLWKYTNLLSLLGMDGWMDERVWRHFHPGKV